MKFSGFPRLMLAPAALSGVIASPVHGQAPEVWEEGLRPTTLSPSLAHVRRQLVFHRVLCEQMESILGEMESVLFRAPADEASRKSYEGFLEEQKGRLTRILETSQYQMGFMGFPPNDFDPSRIQVGLRMDQALALRWGLLNRETLGMDGFTMGVAESARRAALTRARATLADEKARLDALATRMEQVAAFRVTAKKAEVLSDVWDLAPGDEGLLESSLCTVAEDYLARSVECLRRIRALAARGPMGAVDTRGIEVTAMVDEMNRIASHADFGGQMLLTGRFASGKAEVRAEPMSLDGGRIPLALPDVTFRRFFPGLQGYNLLESLPNKELDRRLDSAIRDLESNRGQIAGAATQVRKLLPAPKSPMARLFEAHGVFGKTPTPEMAREGSLTAAKALLEAFRDDLRLACDTLHAKQEGRTLGPKLQVGLSRLVQALTNLSVSSTTDTGVRAYFIQGNPMSLKDLAASLEDWGRDGEMLRKSTSGLGLLDMVRRGLQQHHDLVLAERDRQAFRGLVAAKKIGAAEGANLCLSEAKSWARLALTPVITTETRLRCGAMVLLWVNEAKTLDSSKAAVADKVQGSLFVPKEKPWESKIGLRESYGEILKLIP